MPIGGVYYVLTFLVKCTPATSVKEVPEYKLTDNRKTIDLMVNREVKYLVCIREGFSLINLSGPRKRELNLYALLVLSNKQAKNFTLLWSRNSILQS